MNATIEILRGELERLFSLEELTAMSHELLGLNPADVGGADAKASFAHALTERCVDGDRIEALVDVILVSRQGVDPRLRDIAALLGREELSVGAVIGPFVVVRKLGESELSVVYLAKRGVEERVVKVLRREAVRDKRAVQRFLTANRLVATAKHAGLPRNIEAGELEGGVYYVSYDHIDAQPLAARFARTGASHVNELKPVLRGILEPLAALHKAHLVHGDLKLDNVLVGRPTTGGDPSVALIDFGADRLRARPTTSNGHTGVLAVFGSPKTIAPEQVRGRASDPRSDVYAFGAIMYELLSGKPVFAFDGAADAAFAHLTKEAEAPSTKAPRGWITKEVDDFVLSLLAKDPAARPRDASALLEALETLGRASTAMRAASATFPEERLTHLVDLLIAAPDDPDAAIALEKAVDEGADATKVAEAFDIAADDLPTDTDEGRETKKALLYRAARIFDSTVKDKERAEKVYLEIVELDPSDDIAQSALEEVRKGLGKYEEIVEMLVARSEAAAPGADRARALSEIGRIFAHELDDAEQALLAYTRALCETPTSGEYIAEIERLATDKGALWNEALATIAQGTQSESLSSTERSALLAQAGRWYDTKLGRADLALMAYKQILQVDPASEAANEGLSAIYRRAQQWPELAAILLVRADAAASAPRARDLRTEAAELFELKLNDPARAKEMYAHVLADDPGHAKAGDAMTRIAERTGDFTTLVAQLEKRADARRGAERAAVLTKMAEVYEDHLDDLTEATRRYEAVLAIEPANLNALKGLDRIYNRTGKFRELVENLERQVQLSATPRQKINLLERIASINDEEFLDHARAATALEGILAIDPTNDGALTALARHYRALSRWEELVKLYETHANATSDEVRRVDLHVQRARVLADQVGSPERAMRSYEHVLELSTGHAGALEALAHLREMSGDANAALTAIEALAAKAATPEAKAEQWMRAARLLESRGDKDGAIERYKMALDANPKDPTASAALRNAYGHRGDALSVVALVERELVHAEGDLAKGRLHAELAKVYRDRLRDADKAEAAAKTAIELDPTNVDALVVLGDIAFEGQRYTEAARSYETLVGRATAMSKDDAVRVFVRFIEAFAKSNAARPSMPASSREVGGAPSGRLSSPSIATTHPKIEGALEALRSLAPDDPAALGRAARVVFDHGDPVTAKSLYRELLDKHSAALSQAERADALYRLGESTRKAGELDEAVKPLVEAADLDPSNPAPLQALAKIHEEKGEFEEVIRIKQQRLEIASGAERFDLLLEIGDVEFQRLNDRARASKTYVAALEERPDDRKLLTKLMQLYSEEKDWAKLVEVVQRLADFAAAIVSWRQIGDADQALVFFDKALELDPSLTKALDEAIDVRRQKGDHDGVERLLNLQLDQAKASQDREKIVKVLDQLGTLYQRFLNETELAIDAFEAAQAFDPDDRPRAETLAELYASDVTQYLDKAVKSQAQILERNPYRVESYKLLRRLYTEARRPDAAWCLCQALAVMNLAEPDEERFYRRHRGDNAAPAQASLDDNDWNDRLSHADIDPLVTRIFAMIQPTIIRTRTQPLEALGYDPRYAVDLALHPYPVSQTLYYVQGVLGLPAPAVFQNPNDPSGLGFLHATTPAIVLGRAAFESAVPNQSLAFVAGRHMTYFRPGFYVRHLVPTGTGLKGWLFAAIKLCVPQFPVAPDLVGQVQDAMAAMAQDFQGVERERLASVVSKLLQSGGAIDLKKWVAGIDLTADRAGFLLAHDLGVATEVMRATEDAASVPAKERMKEIVLFGVSEGYFAIREKLGIMVDS
jgi:tetratricopeptide (TPR) repeat protein/tRNA A-37 threonylcarbamoyl transferase component Bud32